MYTDKTTFTFESPEGIKVTSNVCPSKSFASHQFPHGSRTLRLLVRCDEIKNKAKGHKISLDKSQHINTQNQNDNFLKFNFSTKIL